MTNRSMPPGQIIPERPYPDVRDAVEWICRSFGFTERLRIGQHRAQLTFGQGAIIVTERRDVQSSTQHTKFRPSPEDRSGRVLMVSVVDVDKHHEQARLCGVRIINPPTDYPFGERQYTALDLGGHCWTFSQTIADTDPKSWGGALVE